MEDSLNELVEKTETGYNLVVTQENKQIWERTYQGSNSSGA